jgi:DNA modification methylase
MLWNNLELPEQNVYFKDDDTVIYCADCKDILPLLPKVDLVLTDPPYQFENDGGGFYGNWHGKGNEPRTYIKDLSILNCTVFNPLELLNLLNLNLVYGYYFCNKELIDTYIAYSKSRNYMFDVLVMAKYNPIPAVNGHHLNDLEYIIMMREKGTKYYKSNNFDDNRKFYLATCDGENIHPAEKPVNLIQRMITVSSIKESIILDPFLGSGTTAVAAKKLGRKCIGIELEEKYCKIAVERLRQSVMKL